VKKDDSRVDFLAKIIWDYHQLNQVPSQSDAIFVLCSSDTRVAERGAQLFLAGLAPRLIFSGGFGAFTKYSFSAPEAELFAEIAVTMGVPEEAIIIEAKSTNTGENVVFTEALLKEKEIHLNSAVLVTKPYMERRVFSTFKKQWSDSRVQISVTSQQIAYADYFNEKCPREFVIKVMVGDLLRIREYPRLGYQIEQEIPAAVWAAYEELVSLGYGRPVGER
jgi:uncharacterized SAM-binding protein YcdF (DUF218 family)